MNISVQKLRHQNNFQFFFNTLHQEDYELRIAKHHIADDIKKLNQSRF